jgi:hypothetical protein
LEIYNETIRDLLVQPDPRSAPKALDVLKAGDGSICVPGLSEVPCESLEQVLTILQEGNVNRSVASTNMNSASSRSHMYARLTCATGHWRSLLCSEHIDSWLVVCQH